MDSLILNANIYKRSGAPANLLLLNYTLSPLTEANSILQTALQSGQNILQHTVSHDAINRFINTNWRIWSLNQNLLKRLQERNETRITKDWIWILDDTHIEKQYAKKMQMLKWYKDTTGEKDWIKGFNLSSLCCTNGEILYPTAFGFKTIFNTKIEAAIKHISDMLTLGLPVKTITFDSWYFTVKLLRFLVDSKTTFVSKPKMEHVFYVDGIKLNAKQILEMYEEVIAERKEVGKLKLLRVQGDKEWYLLVTNDLSMTRERAEEIYKHRMKIDNPFFRDMKSLLDLENFHTRKFCSLVNHVALRFLLHILLTATKIRKRILHRSMEWVKRLITGIVGEIRSVGDTLIVRVSGFTGIPPPE